MWFHAGWAALLGALALGLLVRSRTGGGWRAVSWQLLLAAGVIAWGGQLLSTIARDHGPGLELERLVLHPGGEDALVLGSSSEHAQVTLPDPHIAPVHAVLAWETGPSGDPVPTLRNVSATHRLEVDGYGLHDAELTARSTLRVGKRTLEVAAPALWPGLVLVDDRGVLTRLRAPLASGLMAFLPGLGHRVVSTLAWLQADGEGVRILDHAPLPGTGPVAKLVTRGRAARITFPTPEDRARHTAVLDRPGEPPSTLGERRHVLRTGEVLTMGRSRYRVDVRRGGVVELAAVGAPSRIPWPDPEGTVHDGLGAVLLSGDPDGRTLTAASLSDGVGFRRLDGLLTQSEGGARTVEVAAGQRLVVSLADGATAQLRVAARAAPAAALAGIASLADARLWTLLLALAVAYLGVTILAARLGIVHARTAGVLHGAALLSVVGLACLYRLADPADPMRAGWALHQARLLAAAFGVALGALVILGGVARLRARRGLRPLRGDLLFRWLEGPDGDGRRSRWLYWVAVLVLLAQQPFGETGITLPGLGSVQPIELARTLLVVYLAFWTSRALDEKRTRVRGAEGLAARWLYMAHALPVLVVLALCYSLHDISPILVFVVFLAVFYALSLMRPSLQVFPLGALRDHLALDFVVVGVVLGGAGWLLLGDPGGTVARRIAVWWDPWSQTAEAYQAMTALWATAAGGVWGAGWSGANGVLPPAVKDDFVLALLAARGGAAAVTLVAATFGAILLSGAAGIGLRRQDGPSAERPALLAGGMLWMLLIQAAVVLGSATGGLPVMGQPLPMVAAAGSHLLLFCLPALATVLVCTRAPLAVVRSARRARRAQPARVPARLPALGAAPLLRLSPPPRESLPAFRLPSMGPISELGPSSYVTQGPVTEGGA
jgi:cell division protein FtsW (lipid II flippase)